ncbi:hypothetical protein AB1207_01170 [Kineococcus endophyticus]|uniref:Uncharacterized protein n=1 Tax=Kineococcus endophyticus TaxID=1181883 RepID=A0ABV3P153_9ACTN
MTTRDNWAELSEVATLVALALEADEGHRLDTLGAIIVPLVERGDAATLAHMLSRAITLAELLVTKEMDTRIDADLNPSTGPVLGYLLSLSAEAGKRAARGEQ